LARFCHSNRAVDPASQSGYSVRGELRIGVQDQQEITRTPGREGVVSGRRPQVSPEYRVIQPSADLRYSAKQFGEVAIVKNRNVGTIPEMKRPTTNEARLTRPTN